MAEPGSSKTPLNASNFSAYNDDIQAAALKTTKLSVALPSDVNFHRSVNSEFAQTIDECSTRTLELANRLIALSEGGHAHSLAKGKGKLRDQASVVDGFAPHIVDVLDQLFEQADMSLDELLGNKRPAKIAVKPPPTSKPPPRSGRLDGSILHAANLAKPQLKFKRKVDNTNGGRRVPALKHKYNAQVPLGYTFTESQSGIEGSQEPLKPHPYRYEIGHISYPRHMFEHRDAEPPSSFEFTPFTWINRPEQLSDLLEKLRKAKEIAVDLEYHSLRSFTGFVCLMQISTREEDFVIDTLALREEMEELNEVFTNPNIVKAFHGAQSDIVWLQQDFNIYVVNMFDTCHASRLLEFPRHSLASLLEMYCDFVPDKRYQLADWRIRPLTAEMQKYARADTHFLLYIYDNLRNALLDRAGGEPSILTTCLERSQETALRVSEPQIYDAVNGQGPGGWNSLMTKWGRTLIGTQLAVFKAVHSWRDAVARSEDESTGYVLPNHYLFQLAERMPADLASLLAIFRPVPPLVRVKSNDLLEKIRNAVKESENATNADVRPVDDPNAQKRVRSPTVNGTAEVAVRREKASTTAASLHESLWLKQATAGSRASDSKLYPSSVTGRSSLFPSGWSNVIGRQVGMQSPFGDVASRIHEALVVAPSLPQLALEANGVTRHAEASTAQASAITAAVKETHVVEAPETPPAASVVKDEVIDSIVTVARSKQKKSKRTKQTLDDDEAAEVEADEKAQGKRAAKIVSPADIAPFDYADAPNILDTRLDEQRGPKTKGKQPKGRRAFEFGNFPAPPRAMNEVRGANKAHTFK